MGRIPDETIEQVRDAADLLEIVGESVELKRTGSDWRGPCPFHGGANRNFAVIPRKNLYYCFVCHAAGDVFSWYRERFGMDYPTAVREVARRVGIPIPETSERTGPDPREPLYQACDVAMTWFAERLRDSDDSEPARRYLLERQFSLEAAAELRLGWAPRGNDFLNAMKQLGVSESALLEAALVMQREDGTLVPRFRGRLLFPIHDLRGRVVGFGGRLLGPGEPKYLNSPETPIFHKGEQLYHIHVAKLAIRKAECAILVEGYFDVIRLSLAGFDHAVAPLGTAFTESQAELIRRYTDEVVICYDSDKAGLKATFRAADTLLSRGVRVRVATMPPGDDPDTVVQRGGAAALEAIIGDASDVLDRKLQLLDHKGWFGDVHKAREALDRLLPTLRAASDEVTRELYISRVAERLGIPREVVLRETAAVGTRAPQQVRQVESGPGRPGPGRHSGPDGQAVVAGKLPGAEIERKLLRLLLLSEPWRHRARDEIPEDRFTVPSYRRIFAALANLEADAPVGDALTVLDERAREVWNRLVDKPAELDQKTAEAEYVGALDTLEEIHSFPEIAAETDRLERRRRMNALSQNGQARFRLYLANSALPVGRRELSPEE